MIVVLDPSAAVDLVLNKGDHEFIRENVKKAQSVISPDLFISEITNVAWKYVKLAGFSKEQAVSLAENALQMIDAFISAQDLWREALGESITHEHPLCDLFYIISARRHDALLLTRDQRMKALAKKLSIRIKEDP